MPSSIQKRTKTKLNNRRLKLKNRHNGRRPNPHKILVRLPSKSRTWLHNPLLITRQHHLKQNPKQSYKNLKHNLQLTRIYRSKNKS